MNRIATITFTLLSSFPVIAAEQDAGIIELRETISKVVDTQSLESAERLNWQARKEEMSALLKLHRKELALLDEELEKAGQSAPGHSDATEEMKAEIEALKSTRRLTSEAVARNVPRTVALAKSFPAPLLKDCEPELSTLSVWDSSSEPRETLQSILSVIAKAQQFNRRLTRSSEIRDNREVEVLYLGLAGAYYAGSKKTAGTGKPGAEGWTWQSRPEIHSEVQMAFDALDKKRPPSMVRLPLELK
ncbi:DUF3450 family protein [Luteolibacter algae]|uniref:DUF3450 family protein n=1 Tax=Luteolibacter algae TaxID=454151 RepID=A0ABW5D448_9BACT